MRGVRALAASWLSRGGANRATAQTQGGEGPRARRRPRWAVVVSSGCVGSAFGLAFGVGALNRPLANGLLFYALGFLVGAALAAGLTSVRRAVPLAGAGRRDPGRRERSGAGALPPRRPALGDRSGPSRRATR